MLARVCFLLFAFLSALFAQKFVLISIFKILHVSFTESVRDTTKCLKRYSNLSRTKNLLLVFRNAIKVEWTENDISFLTELN